MEHIPRDHIERIRRERFFIGREEKNPLAEDMHHAVNYLSEELYAKDVHFLMELIQNAEDNEYLPGVHPSLEFVITAKDITCTGATATLLVFNNERGFSPANIESICRIGKSTKKGKRKCGYIGEKGIGFKSVFLITSSPHIFSNGYQIRFNEEPSPECNIGYVVPEWVDENPTISDIQKIYGSAKSLPTTTLIFPLKHEKVVAVKQQLSNMQPEVMLFLSKIKRLSVREENNDPKLSTVTAVSISSETDFQTRKQIDAESYTVHLSAQDDDNSQENQCSYYIWRQKFPVKTESRVEKRIEVEEWVVTLAFPFEQRLNRGMGLPGVYAFLPTEMATNFPFIIQADFILASSRETILLDNKWNIGILHCVPSAFVSAFVSLVKSIETAPPSSLPPMFRFLPVDSSQFELLDNVRLSIKERVSVENIILCESYSNQKIFCKPSDVSRLMPTFWDILMNARKQGVALQNLSSHGTFILNSAFDNEEYNNVLSFLGVKHVGNEWYAKCIESSNLLMAASEELYLDVLSFFIDHWSNDFNNVPLLKYVDHNGKVSFWNIKSATQCKDRLCLSDKDAHITWIIDWNKEFGRSANRYFVPKNTQTTLRAYPKKATVMEWLQIFAAVEVLSLYEYGILIMNSLNDNRKLVVAFTHFLYHSFSKNYMSEWEISQLCDSIPLVDHYGNVIRRRSGVLVPANGSKWVRLIGSNPWRAENYVELGVDYIHAGHFSGIHTSENQLLKFIQTHIKASDVPNICPPNASFPTVSASLTKENTFLMLEWIRNLRHKGLTIPEKFLQCIKNGCWLRTSVGDRPPKESFLPSSEWGNLLQMGSVLVDIPLINPQFYDDRIMDYKEELKTLGVMFEFGDACRFIGRCLMQKTASSNLTRSNVISMLKFMRLLREKYLPLDEFLKSIKEERWLKTSSGYRSPVGSILYDSEWFSASCISNLPFIDEDYYGSDIAHYKSELQLLGVIVGFEGHYHIVIENINMPSTMSSMAVETILFTFECIRHAPSSAENLIRKLRDQKCLKTCLGFRNPCECILPHVDWECLLKLVDDVPLIDEKYYGDRISSYREELRRVGVIVGYEEASKAIADRFKQLILSLSITKENVLVLLECYRKLMRKDRFPKEIITSIRSEKWLWTRIGYRSSIDSILFDPEWESLSPIVLLPVIEVSWFGKKILEYRNELKDLGVVVDFKHGARFVIDGLNIPQDPLVITPECVLSLLKCIRNLTKGKSDPLPEKFMSSLKKKWLKTTMGYKSPDECILYDLKTGSFLELDDGPFIDEEFYGSEIASFRDELKEVGVMVDVVSGRSLVASHLNCHSHFTAIARIYWFLSELKWEPDEQADWIWIPNGGDSGKWVCSKVCVLHDNDKLFGSELHILEKHYERKLLSFFSMALGVRHSPTMEDYCKLWNKWENTHHQLTYAECCAFWTYIAKHWNLNAEKFLTRNVTKLPMNTVSGLKLSDKQVTFIPDDLLLKDLFDQASLEPLFVWHPISSCPSLPRAKLYNIYRSIGVRPISEATEKGESPITEADLKKIDPSKNLFKVGLFRIVLGFLADPALEFCSKERHQSVQCLCDLTAYESEDPITMNYSLPISSGKTLNVKASRIFRWEREKSKFYMQKIDRPSNPKGRIKSATYFSEAISEGLLWARTDQNHHIVRLSELIKLGCLLDFEEEAVEFLLKSKNLQLMPEDEEFLSSFF